MSTYGIDLGTTYSCVATVDGTGRAHVTKNAAGEDTTPSVVFFESPTNVVVGEEAKNTALLLPDQVVSLVKRQMGEQARFEFHGNEHTPETVSALILRELARAAGEHERTEVEEVVVTVPAYFGVTEREATRRAGEIAGLTVLDVVPEPVAAALHYQSLDAERGPRHLLVYDLGGGTFDTTVIRVEDNDVRVVCTDGDHRLGGADWDEKLTDHLLERFTAQYPEADPGGDEQFLQDVSDAAERLKRSLTVRECARHNLRFAGASVRVELGRGDFEALTADLLERTLTITERTVATARERGVDTFDDVLLVGGMTRMPAVSAGLRSRFGFEPHLHEPDLAVAKGAALFALVRRVKSVMTRPGASDTAGEGPEDGPEAVRRRAEEVGRRLGLSTEEVQRLADKTVTSVSPRAFGVKTIDSSDPVYESDPMAARQYVSHLLEANAPLPAVAQDGFATVWAGQEAVRIDVWEQAGAVLSEELEHNVQIGDAVLSGLPPSPANTPFRVEFHLTETGLLNVRAWEPEGGSQVRFDIRIGGMSPESVAAARDAVGLIRTSG
ncbi:Hsp70 family protein [Nocardiopsis sp. HNM0947]|uniref:Hsp70 family protein n=1 Tax=Nocardiopsis coralli TaxID=2772213 RepID=A0ABR9PEQ8_9ACTN|nr:Hsp70 family protein [Nocardiopsis coralli]MBE3002317.1 Hsp70 family protein [Nocardiopsis coralli]